MLRRDNLSVTRHMVAAVSDLTTHRKKLPTILRRRIDKDKERSTMPPKFVQKAKKCQEDEEFDEAAQPPSPMGAAAIMEGSQDMQQMIAVMYAQMQETTIRHEKELKRHELE